MSSPLKFIAPSLLNDDVVSSWFSLKNADFLNTENAVPGLNIGYNTNATVEEINANRALLSRGINTPLSDIAYAKQIHGTGIKEVSKGDYAGDYDGLITTTIGIALAIQVADCAAVLLCDKGKRIISAVHAGWRGAVGGIVPKAIDLMVQKGSSIENIQIFISPCISLNKFEVGDEVAQRFPDSFVDRESFEKPHVDLGSFIRWQLSEKGILEGNIENSTACTFTDENEFYSYRREGDKSGRMMAIIKLNS
tara:strand:+ start:9660 stop:10412 length:753 start_codon:yes stop_codon:yes gene_type:complete